MSVSIAIAEYQKRELDLDVRAARIDDVEGIVEVSLRVGEEGLFVAEEPPIDRHERRLWLEHGIDAPWTLVLVATSVQGCDRVPDGGRIGVAARHDQPGSRQAWRNRGVGTRLVEGAIRWAKTQDAHKLAAEVFPHDQPTLNLFQKLEFTLEGRLRRHYRRRSGQHRDVVLLGFPLEDPDRITHEYD